MDWYWLIIDYVLHGLYRLILNIHGLCANSSYAAIYSIKKVVWSDKNDQANNAWFTSTRDMPSDGDVVI